MECKLVPGQHVLCIEAEVPNPLMTGEIKLPEVGKVYTVARVSIGELAAIPCVVLEELGEQEVVCNIDGVLYEGHVLFDHTCFKPLDRLKVSDFVGTLVLA